MADPILKPCPFCGGKASFEEVACGSSVDTKSACWSVGCDERGGEIECFGYQSTTTFARKVEAAEAWNRRTGNG